MVLTKLWGGASSGRVEGGPMTECEAMRSESEVLTNLNVACFGLLIVEKLLASNEVRHKYYYCYPYDVTSHPPELTTGYSGSFTPGNCFQQGNHGHL